MNHPLDGVNRKIVRAEEHLTLIQDLTLRHKQHCGLRHETSSNPNMIDVFLDFPHIDLGFNVILGEFLYNLRSALDHIVWQLVLVNRETPGRRNAFPISKTSADFAMEIKRDKLCGVSLKAKAIIEGLQPYNRGHIPENDPLWRLNHLENIDKHRYLAVTSILHRAYLELTSDPRGVQFGGLSISEPEYFRNGTYICSYNANELPGQANMEMHFKDGLFIAFEEPPLADLDACSVTGNMVEFVKDMVIPRFDPFFR